MSEELTINEIQDDLYATAKDIGRLAVICDVLRHFITDSHGEDRSSFRADLFKYEALYDQAKRLGERIADAYAKAKTNTP